MRPVEGVITSGFTNLHYRRQVQNFMCTQGPSGQQPHC